MVNFINTLINDKTTPKSLSEGGRTSNHIGTLAKLASEMQLIEGLQPIRLTGSRNVFLQQSPVQLLEGVSAKNQPFTLLNMGPAIDVQANKHAELEINTKQQLTNLVLNSENNAKLTALLSQSSTAQQAIKTISNTILSSSPLSTTAASATKETQAKQSITAAPIGETRTASIGKTSENLPTPQLSTHPKTQQTVIQQQVTLTSQIQTLKVVGNKQPDNNQPVTAGSNQASISSQISKQVSKQEPSQTTSNQPSDTLPSNNSPSNNSPSNNSLSNKRAGETLNTYFQNTPSAVKPMVNGTTSQTASIEAKSATQQLPQSNVNKEIAVGETPLTQTGKGNNEAKTSATQSQNSATSLPPTQQSKPQTFTVTDGHSNFEIKSAKKLAVGSQLQVFFDPKGQLQVIPPQDAKAPSVVNNALSQSLPQQFNEQELGKAIQDLTATLQNKDTPPSIQKAISQLLQSFPSQQDLASPNALKQSLQNSGVFLESNLLNVNTEITKDVKLNWLKLQSATQSIPSQDSNYAPPAAEQLKVSHHALERITTHQLKNLVEQTKAESQGSPIFIELPVRDKDSTSLVQFQIERDSSQADNIKPQKRRWLAKLRFDFPETGKFEARVRVQENQAGIIFVAEEKQTERMIRQNFQELKQDLEKKEIELEQLDCFCRSLTEEKAATPSDRLIDVRT